MNFLELLEEKIISGTFLFLQKSAQEAFVLECGLFSLMIIALQS